MRIFLHHRDSRENNPDFRDTCGSFSIILYSLEKPLIQAGVDIVNKVEDADIVLTADSLATNYRYPNKKSIQLNFQDTINVISDEAIDRKKKNPSLSLASINRHTSDLWNEVNETCAVIGPAVDINFWQRTAESPKDVFRFIFSSFSNVRSGLELLLKAWVLAFKNNKDVELVIKNTSDNKKLSYLIEGFNGICKNISYVNKRLSFLELRELYSSCHFGVNIYRFSGHGMILGELGSMGIPNLIGNFNPSNTLISNEMGYSLNPIKTRKIQELGSYLESNFHLANTFKGLHFKEPALVHDYDVEEYAKILLDCYNNYNIFNSYKIREQTAKIWNSNQAAKNLIDFINTLE